MDLKGKKIMVLAEEAFEDLELWYPVLRLREEGCEVTIVGTGSSDTYRGKHGVPVKVDKNIGEVSADDYDGVVVPGGSQQLGIVMQKGIVSIR
jgi:protease I